jgi:hypothetical protein
VLQDRVASPASTRPSRLAGLGRWLAQHRLLVGIAVALVYVFPYYPGIRSANELPRVYLTMAMVDDGTFAIRSRRGAVGARPPTCRRTPAISTPTRRPARRCWRCRPTSRPRA